MIHGAFYVLSLVTPISCPLDMVQPSHVEKELFNNV